MAGKINDQRKKTMVGANPQTGNVVLLEDQKILLMATDDSMFINCMSGKKFPYKFAEILEVRDVVIHDNVVESLAYLTKKLGA